MQAERQATEEAKKAHAEAQARGEELLKKFEEASKKNDLLQDTVQRFLLYNLQLYNF